MATVQRVANGAELLTAEYVGDWRADINRDTLVIDDFYLCVLAHLYGNYSAGVDALGLTQEQAVAHGFDVAPGEDADALTAAWLDVL